MSIFRYTLPSGAAFTLNAPEGTSQAVADDIFYKQVAAGTFVDFKPGDSISSAKQTLTNFGLSRLFRTTAGVDEKTVLAAIAGLPVVVTMPANLSKTPITNRINTADYIGVISDPKQGGKISLPPKVIGQLQPKQVQGSMAQIAAKVNQPCDAITSTDGIGKYGLNCSQLERAGYIKPGYCSRYCSDDNFVSFMNSPSVWTGLDGIDSLDQLLASCAKQNKIQEKLMNIGYDQLVQAGVITPPTTRSSIPSISTGHVYTNKGEIVSTSVVNLMLNNFTLTPDLTTSPCSLTLSEHRLGEITAPISSLGTAAVADYAAGLETLTTGAVRFVDEAQVPALSVSDAAVEQVAISNTLSEDIGALVVNASKFGIEPTIKWVLIGSAGDFTTDGTNAYYVYVAENDPEKRAYLSPFEAGPGKTEEEIQKAVLDAYAKDTQASINFTNNNLAGSVAGVQPAAAFTGTTNRNSVDAATVRIIGSDKVPPPIYQVPSLETLGIQADINQAKDKLKTTGGGGKDIDGYQNTQLL